MHKYQDYFHKCPLLAHPVLGGSARTGVPLFMNGLFTLLSFPNVSVAWKDINLIFEGRPCLRNHVLYSCTSADFGIRPRFDSVSSRDSFRVL